MAQIQETSGNGKLDKTIEKILTCGKGCYTMENLGRDLIEVKTAAKAPKKSK